MTFDTRTAQTALENALRDTVLYAYGRRLPAVASVAALRAMTTRGEVTTALDDDALIAISDGDGVTGYRWAQASTASDNGSTVIKPSDVTANGRWLEWTSALRFSPSPGDDSIYLHEATSGPLARVIVLDKQLSEEEMEALVAGAELAVFIEATGDDPTDLALMTGFRWNTIYTFTVTVVAVNLRDRREAAQGSAVPGESSVGGNTIDGNIKALLGGTQLALVADGVRNVQVGRCRNWISDLAQRRVFRQRVYAIHVTEENPAAPNDTGPAEEVDAQAKLSDLHDQESLDLDDCVTSGLTVAVVAGLASTVSAGTAKVAGAAVTYLGELVTLDPYTDTYRDLNPDGTITFVGVAAQGEEPAVTDDALRIGMTRTSANAVLFDRFIAATSETYGPTYQFPLT